MPLTDKQQDYLRSCSRRWNIKVGATGSGKSWLDYAVAIPKRVLACRGEGAIVMLGNTRGTLCRNIIEPMRAIWGERLVSNLHADSTVMLFGKKVHVLGADSKKHVARIQGMTIEYAYGDEMTTWAQDVFEMLKSRLRCVHSHFDGTCNPDNPQHYIKAFLDSGADIYCQKSTIDDNPFLPAEFVADLKREYTGTVYYDRFILGNWAAAEGVIYRPFADSLSDRGDNRFLWPSQQPLALMKVVIGIDFGGNGSQHAFVATGFLQDCGGVVVLQSERLPAKDSTPESLSRAVSDFCAGIFARFGRIDAVYCDSAEQVLIRGVQQHLRSGAMPWLANKIYNAAKTEINDRIRLTSILMGGGRFWYLPQAASLRDALAHALWSGKTPGKDERLDDGSTDVDSLDAFEYTIERDTKRLLRQGE